MSSEIFYQISPPHSSINTTAEDEKLLVAELWNIFELKLMIVNSVSLALEALFVFILVRLNSEDDCWTETLDLKTVTGLTLITSCFLGSWSISLEKCPFICYCFSFYVCHIVHYSLIKNNIYRVRTYCISVTFSD